MKHRFDKYSPVSGIADIFLGGTPSRSIPQYWDGEFLWASAKDIASNDERYIYNTTERITIEGLNNSAAKMLPRDTIVITARGTVGAIRMLGRAMSFNQTCYGLIAKEGTDSSFLFYALRSALDEIKTLSYGTVFETITTKTFDSILIPIPSLPEQRAIAAVLGSLDDKIELNRRMNETLEAIAQTLFMYWFVYNPESKKWSLGTVSDDFELTMGQSPPGETYNEDGEGIPFFQGRADFGFRYPSNRVFCIAPTRFAKTGDTLVSVRAPVGDVNMAAMECAIGRGVAAIRHKTGSRSYTYYAMRFLEEDFARFEAEGTVFGSINKADFQNLEINIPPSEQVELFEKTCYPIDQMIENNEKESRTLATLRDTLLLRLFRGEIRVKVS